MMPIDSVAAGLPSWSEYFSFYVSAVLTVAALIAAVYRASQRAELELRLTRESFFRWIDIGEALFANVVMLGRNAPVLIESASFSLKKTDGAEKTYPVAIVNIGEKARGQGTIAEHYFHTTSPITFVPVDNPQRQTYMCVLGGYAAAIRDAVENFRSAVYAIKDREGGLAAIEALPAEEATILVEEVRGLIDKACSAYMEAAQLEGGNYTLTLLVRYRRTAARFRVSRTVSSSIRFTVTKDVRERVRARLPRWFEAISVGILSDKPQPYSLPEYAPESVEEL